MSSSRGMKIGCFIAPAGQDDSPNKDRKCQRQASACLCVSRSVLSWPLSLKAKTLSVFQSPWTCPVLSVRGVCSRICSKLHHLVMSGLTLCPSAFCKCFLFLYLIYFLVLVVSVLVVLKTGEWRTKYHRCALCCQRINSCKSITRWRFLYFYSHRYIYKRIASWCCMNENVIFPFFPYLTSCVAVLSRLAQLILQQATLLFCNLGADFTSWTPAAML